MSVLNVSLSCLIFLQSAIFNFQSLLTVILLLICTCAYIRALAPSLLDKNKTGYDQIIFQILNNEVSPIINRLLKDHISLIGTQCLVKLYNQRSATQLKICNHAMLVPSAFQHTREPPSSTFNDLKKMWSTLHSFSLFVDYMSSNNILYVKCIFVIMQGMYSMLAKLEVKIQKHFLACSLM